jgi:hypothetical protein
MLTHIKVLGVLFIALSALGLCAAIFFLFFMGAAAMSVHAGANPHDAAVALPLIGVIGSALFVFILLLSLPGVVVGIGLLKFSPWARIAGIVLSALNLISIPFGTLLGIYGLWVLLNKETEALFASPVRLP